MASSKEEGVCTKGTRCPRHYSSYVWNNSLGSSRGELRWVTLVIMRNVKGPVSRTWPSQMIFSFLDAVTSHLWLSQPTASRSLQLHRDWQSTPINPLSFSAMSRDSPIQKFGFPKGALPTKYLGLPLASKVLLISLFSPLIDSIANRINKWNNSYLSLAGRAELVQSVVQGIECFWLRCLPLPSGVTDHIHTLLRRFVWGSKACPVKWKTVCLPKSEGGLGFRNLSAWNKALLLKIVWNIHAKADSLWIRCLHSEILDNRDFWTARCEG